MASESNHAPQASSLVNMHPDAVLCALVLVPRVLSRNRFFGLFEDSTARRLRKRAKRLRGIIRQLTAQGREPAEVTGRHELQDGRVLLRYRIKHLSFERTSALSPLEAALLQYAMHRAGLADLSEPHRSLVETALGQLSAELPLEGWQAP